MELAKRESFSKNIYCLIFTWSKENSNLLSNHFLINNMYIKFYMPSPSLIN